MKDPIVWSIGLAKFALAGLLTFLFRLVTPMLGLPNVTPLMSTELAGAKAYGPWVGGAYGFLGMVLVDLAMGAFDPVRSTITAVCYATVAIVFGYVSQGRRASLKDFLVASVLGTLFFDAVTGCLMGPILYHAPWMDALIGQIPFTAKHLAGNIGFGLAAPWFFKAFANCTFEFKLLGFPPHTQTE